MAHANQQSDIIFAPDLILRGWRKVEDVPRTVFDPGKHRLVPFLRDELTSGEEMRAQAKQLNANKGLDDAKHMLGWMNRLPAGHLFFPGTLLCDPDGDLCIPYLYCGGQSGRWRLEFLKLNVVAARCFVFITPLVNLDRFVPHAVDVLHHPELLNRCMECA